MSSFDDDIGETRLWFTGPRFRGITRLYSARQVVEQRGTIAVDYTVARTASTAFYDRLRSLFEARKSITTFGPYSPGQAVAMKRMGIDGIYLGGWATSAKGSISEDPGPDLASYPLNQVPDEAAALVRALLTADRNQQFARSRMSPKEREAVPAHDFQPFIIADADTGHGGDAHVRNLIRRFVEAGVPGYHIEDQRPGTKKCGHQGGKVLVGCDEQIKRLNAARLQLDIMRVPGIIVARTDAEAANLLDGRGDERDQPFLLGATNLSIPSYKACFLALLRRMNLLGLDEINGHRLYAISPEECASADDWLGRSGLEKLVNARVPEFLGTQGGNIDALVDDLSFKLAESWHTEAGMMTYGEAVADVIIARGTDGESLGITVEEWRQFSAEACLYAATEKARSIGIHANWDCELARTPEGFYQIQGGIPYAVAESLAVAPYADLLWMETKTADLADAREFAHAIHAKFPNMMLAYNLSPSFNWDSTGMGEDEMRQFPDELGKMGFVFNFITYGGHQIDGRAGEEFASALKQDGMLALARLQRNFRLVESPYRTPQTLVGGPRLDGALAAASGRTATTTAMGKGSTQFQHLVQSEASPKLLEGWLARWVEHYGLKHKLKVELRPVRAGSELLELKVLGDAAEKLANVIFSEIRDRRGRDILLVRDQNTFDESLRKKRLMSLIHIFLIWRYKSVAVHYVSPTEDNRYQTARMQAQGIYRQVNDEAGQIIVADVNPPQISVLVESSGQAMGQFISRQV